MSTISGLLAEAKGSGDAELRHEAEILLGHVIERERAWLFTHPDFVPEADAVMRFRRLIEARQRGTPVAYLIGRRGFWTLDLEVTPAVLIPRPETELLVELALQRIPLDAEFRVADLGTGSGAIALAIASERPRAQVLATDSSVAALEIAQRNARNLGIENVEFALGDWCEALGSRRFDLIVSNPPYIAEEDAHLAHGDLRFEPQSALASGADGLDAIRSIIEAVPRHLDAGSWLLFEHGYDQASLVNTLLAEHEFIGIESWRDIAGQDRASGGRKS